MSQCGGCRCSSQQPPQRTGTELDPGKKGKGKKKREKKSPLTCWLFKNSPGHNNPCIRKQSAWRAYSVNMLVPLSKNTVCGSAPSRQWRNSSTHTAAQHPSSLQRCLWCCCCCAHTAQTRVGVELQAAFSGLWSVQHPPYWIIFTSTFPLSSPV